MKGKKPKGKKPNRRRQRRTRIILIIVGGLIVALALFFGLFYTTKYEVVGNTRYSSQEIEEMAITNIFRRNSVLLTVFHSEIRMDEGDKAIPFMESIQVEYIDRNTIRLHVNEKTPVGFIRDNGMDYYFDKDGMVLEAFTANSEKDNRVLQTSPTPTATPAPVGISSDQPASGDQPIAATETPVPVTETPVAIGTDGMPSSDTQAADTSEQNNAAENAQVTGSASKEGTYGSSSDTIEFRPALTDVPLIMGLPYTKIAVDEELDVEYKGVFNSIMALTKLIDRYEINPDFVEIGENYTFILHYGGVRINLGKDVNLEKKMSRVNAILPKLSGMSGVLHLEDFTDETQNIIFDKDV